MATNTSSHPAKAGFNQSGGAYFIVISSIAGVLKTYTPGSGSGGAATVGSFAAYNDTTGGNWSTNVGAGRLIKDMGKTVVSAGRTFRKFQVVVGTNENSSPSFGVSGTVVGTYSYLTGYLETGRDGAEQVPDLPQIARYY
jgi:hypothetical protein